MNTDRIVTVLKAHYPDIPVFDSEIKKEEVAECPSFFMFRVSNRYKRGESGRSLLRSVYVSFVTKESMEINLEALIPDLQTVPLYFIDSDEDLGKIQNTDTEAKMITMEFTAQIRGCMI
jgi:hypothetical protein